MAPQILHHAHRGCSGPSSLRIFLLPSSSGRAQMDHSSAGLCIPSQAQLQWLQYFPYPTPGRPHPLQLPALKQGFHPHRKHRREADLSRKSDFSEKWLDFRRGKNIPGQTCGQVPVDVLVHAVHCSGSCLSRHWEGALKRHLC